MPSEQDIKAAEEAAKPSQAQSPNEKLADQIRSEFAPKPPIPKGVSEELINRLFTYAAPKGDQQERYVRLREEFKKLATLVIQLTPASAEQTLAIRSLHLASMQVNSAIAVNE